MANPGKKFIVSDLDGTLTKSREVVNPFMLQALTDLVNDERYVFCVISGASYRRMWYQLVNQLQEAMHEGSTFYQVAQSGGSIWEITKESKRNLVYARMEEAEKQAVLEAIQRTVNAPSYPFERLPIDALVEDKESQLTFSIVGYKAKYPVKKRVDPTGFVRKIMAACFSAQFPNLEIRVGGTSSIDFTPANINKRYGVDFLRTFLCFEKDEVIYIGDKCFPGGNDWIGNDYNYIQVEEVKTTLRWILKFLSLPSANVRQKFEI